MTPRKTARPLPAPAARVRLQVRRPDGSTFVAPGEWPGMPAAWDTMLALQAKHGAEHVRPLIEELEPRCILLTEVRGTFQVRYLDPAMVEAKRIPAEGLCLQYLPVSPTSYGILAKLAAAEAKRRKCPLIDNVDPARRKGAGRFAKMAAEFPDFDVATLPAIPEGWEDGSWHNDACPKVLPWADAGPDGPEVFIDYADTALREIAGARRFTLMLGDETRLATDDWAELLRAVEGLRVAGGAR